MSNEKGGGRGSGPSGSPSALERYLAKQKEQKERKEPRVPKNDRPLSGAVASEEAADQPTTLGRWERFDHEPTDSREPDEPPPTSDVKIAEVRIAAEVGTRLLALLVDWIIVGCLTIPMTRATSALLSIAFGPVIDRHGDGFDTVASCLVVYFYYGYFYSRKGASPGKLLFNLEVIDAETGRYLSPWRAFFREAIGKFISMVPFGMGYIIAAFRQDRRALHDLLFDTNVVSKR